MKAIFKDNKRLLVRNLNKEDKVLLNAFVDKFKKFEVELTELIDIDNNLDGVTFSITDRARNKINYKVPFIQILIQDTSTTLDLETDRETTIELINEYPEYIEAVFDRSELHLYANEVKSLEGTTKQYTLYAVLNKPGCEQTTVPINVTVIYRKDIGVTNYNDLDDLPKINQVTVIHEKSLKQYGIQEEMDTVNNKKILDIIDNIFD